MGTAREHSAAWHADKAFGGRETPRGRKIPSSPSGCFDIPTISLMSACRLSKFLPGNQFHHDLLGVSVFVSFWLECIWILRLNLDPTVTTIISCDLESDSIVIRDAQPSRSSELLLRKIVLTSTGHCYLPVWLRLILALFRGFLIENRWNASVRSLQRKLFFTVHPLLAIHY